ncbi:hypothetical protein DA2_0089 [Desulfovibrio sp. A2]|nr:hypothetical protein DA2_0089 [Desulfovibrio sp. A2]
MAWRACCAVWLHPLPHVLGSPWLTACCAGIASPACAAWALPFRDVPEGVGRKHGADGVPRQDARRTGAPAPCKDSENGGMGQGCPPVVLAVQGMRTSRRAVPHAGGRTHRTESRRDTRRR